MKGKGVKWGLKLADDTKFVLGENDAEYRANICFFSAFLGKIYMTGCKQRERFCKIIFYKKQKLKSQLLMGFLSRKVV